MKEIFMVENPCEGEFHVFEDPADGLSFVISKLIKWGKNSKESGLSSQDALELIEEAISSFNESNRRKFHVDDCYYGFYVNYHKKGE